MRRLGPVIAHCTDSVDFPSIHVKMLRKVFRIGTLRYNWLMSAHASQAFSIAHCTDSEDLPMLQNDLTYLYRFGENNWQSASGM